MMPGSREERPITHTWRRRDGLPRPSNEPEHPRIGVEVPGGPKPDADSLAADLSRSLDRWPLTVLRLVGTLQGGAGPGSWKGRWLRSQRGRLIDASLCDCTGDRCFRSTCPSHRLLGPHLHGSRVLGGPWAPLSLRASAVPDGPLQNGTDIRAEVVFAGKATQEIPGFVRALLKPALGLDEEPGFVRWRSVFQMVADDEGELFWRKASPTDPAALVALHRLDEPAVRPGRLMVQFVSPTVLSQRDEQGVPGPDLPLIIDRIGRTVSVWLKRTGHQGPPLPDVDLLRAAADAEIAADHSRVIWIPSNLLGADDPPPGRDRRREPPDPGPDRIPALVGSITWTGDFRALAPLLRVANSIGVGPGRQNGLGEINIR
jgi:hypothetical protein